MGIDEFVWDARLTGWGFKCSANGHTTWVVKQGNKRTKFADFPQVSIEVAKERAKELLKFNPSDELTLGDAVERYIEQRGTDGRHRNEQAQVFHNTILPALNPNRPLALIRKSDVVNWLDTKSEGARPNLFAALNPFLKWCEERELIAANPLDKVSTPSRGPSRDRTLSDAELQAFWQSTDYNEPYRNLFRFLLVTGARRNEAALAKASEFNLARRVWIIPAHRSKNGRAFEVFLSEPALEILSRQKHATRARKPVHQFGPQYVFGLTGFSGAKERLDTEMQSLLPSDLPPWRLHDLRRTMATRMQQPAIKARREHIEAVLNHTPPKLVGTYQTDNYLSERRAALTKWAQELERIVASPASSSSHERNLTQALANSS